MSDGAAIHQVGGLKLREDVFDLSGLRKSDGRATGEWQWFPNCMP